YLLTLKLNHCDILDVFQGIQFLPLDKQTFLRVQCFVNFVEAMFVQVKYTAFLYNDQLYLLTLKLNHCDILDVFQGIQFLPLDKQTFLRVQCFVNFVEAMFVQVKYTAFLYNDQLVWSGLEPEDMQVVYRYLVTSLLPAHMETELQGGSMPRHSTSPFSSTHYGRFVTGPLNLQDSCGSTGKVPKVHINNLTCPESYHLIVYRALSATLCLFVD
ncbi:unnamed protein product, partial [Timema podura]|nr:unnamed protein product [Timema podura]